MAVTSEIVKDEKKLRIAVSGRFDFGMHQAFRETYEKVSRSDFECVEVDLRDANYLDSSALGMLLLLRDYAGGDHAKIKIINICADVEKILAISNFDKLFELEKPPVER
ncbi:STAS domain-containing protein [Pseudomonas sp. nanlin1]|uniref:STAS domain-containing protein n=1 Tax=Pseudomonas sp. nanlin1 TaxID=3040605 RepID=UPI00388E9378